MYIRTTKNKRGDAYYHLVESFREDGKVKQRTLLSLGRVEDNKLEQLSEALSKHLDTIRVLDLAKHIDINSAYIYGSLLILDRLMETLGINSVISEIATQHEKLSYDLKKILFTLITSRFVKPVSKLAQLSQILTCALKTQGRQIIKDNVDIDTEQIFLVLIKRLFDLFFVPRQNIKAAINMLKRYVVIDHDRIKFFNPAVVQCKFGNRFDEP